MSRLGPLPALLWAAALHAQPLAPAPTPPDAGQQPALGVQLPLDLPFHDSEGRAVPLRSYFGDRPVLLVPGYYRCPQLCGLLMQGLLESLHDGDVPPASYRLLRVSIDPAETPADARARGAVDLAYARHLAAPGRPPETPALDLLTGPPASLRALTQRLGYRYEPTDTRTDEGAAFAHPATAIVLTPQGRVSSYLNGIRFEPEALRMAVNRAALGRVGGAPGLDERLALLCAHIDPRLGRHSEAVLRGLQAVGVGVAVALAVLFWRQRTGR
jgi:protein SCO1/2